MSSIHPLLPAAIPASNRTQKAKRKANAKAQVESSTNTSVVVSQVARSIQQLSDSELEQAQLAYDLPNGRSRKALEQYWSVMTQAKREELAQLLGIDIYI